MTDENPPLKRERIGEPTEFPAPSPEVAAQLRALLPPLPRREPIRKAS